MPFFVPFVSKQRQSWVIKMMVEHNGRWNQLDSAHSFHSNIFLKWDWIEVEDTLWESEGRLFKPKSFRKIPTLLSMHNSHLKISWQFQPEPFFMFLNYILWFLRQLLIFNIGVYELILTFLGTLYTLRISHMHWDTVFQLQLNSNFLREPFLSHLFSSYSRYLFWYGYIKFGPLFFLRLHAHV